MARVIKFRGKSIDDGKWVVGDLIQSKNKKTGIWPIGSDNGVVPVHPKSVGQFTGLTDRNGTEIFEGDVVIQSWKATIDYNDFATEKSGRQTGIVVIRTKGVCLSPCLCQYDDKQTEATITRNKPLTGNRSEVIGNSFDDPGLFERICEDNDPKESLSAKV